MSYRPLILALSVLALTAAPSASAKLYKWVDQNGKVHYSDKVPPEASSQAREEKSETSLQTIRKVEGTKTPEELEAARKAEAEQKAREEAEAKRQEEDRILLLTFSKPEEIERARDDRLSAVDGRIKLTQDRLNKLQPQLDQAKKEAAALERNGKATPQELHKRIGVLEKQIVDYQTFLDERNKERVAIETKFNADLARFKELTAQNSGR